MAVNLAHPSRRTAQEHATACGKKLAKDIRMRHPFGEDERAESPTWLYRYYANDAELLYVGISNEPHTRMMRHVRNDWFKRAVATFYECFPLRRLAEAAEQLAIITEDPTYNEVRRHCGHVSAHDVNWYFDETGDLLVGRCRYWASPRDVNLAEMPCHLAEPAPIAPELRNRF